MKNSNDTIGKRTRDLPAGSKVRQPTASPRAPLHSEGTQFKYRSRFFLVPSRERKKKLCVFKILFQIWVLGGGSHEHED
jgi:hypothetical protein